MDVEGVKEWIAARRAIPIKPGTVPFHLLLMKRCWGPDSPFLIRFDDYYTGYFSCPRIRFVLPTAGDVFF